MSRETKSEVISKIEKLLRLSKSGNQHEAELAAQRASELMKKYQIESADLEVENVRSGADYITREYYVVQGLKMKLHWVEMLAQACAVLYDGTVLVGYELWGTSFSFVGFKSEVPLMKSLFEHLYHAWKGIVEHDLERVKQAYYRERPNMEERGWSPRNTMKFKHGHGQGYSDALCLRCMQLRDERKRAVQVTSTALVLVRDGALNTWKQQNGVKNAKIKQTEGDQIGHALGAKAGRSVALGGALK